MTSVMTPIIPPRDCSISAGGNQWPSARHVCQIRSFAETFSGPERPCASVRENVRLLGTIYLRYAWVRRDDGRGTRGELFAIELHRSLHAVIWFSAIGREGRFTYWCFVPVIYPGLAARLVLSLVACP